MSGDPQVTGDHWVWPGSQNLEKVPQKAIFYPHPWRSIVPPFKGKISSVLYTYDNEVCFFLNHTLKA